MGPRSDERGKRIDLRVYASGYVASMGPRSDERGKTRHRKPHRLKPEASMGPRSDERGKRAARNRTQAARDSFNWGRVRMNAESAETPITVATFHRFNGAAFG